MEQDTSQQPGRRSEYSDEQVEQHILLRFSLVSKIGSGAFGHVWKAVNKVSHRLCAIKKVFLAFQNKTDAQRVYREISILRQLKHEGVVQLQEVIRADNGSDIYLVFQHMQSDLYNAIRDRVLDDIHRKYIVYQLASALKYLHSAGIVHRDIKPSNVLLAPCRRAKLCDFGLSRTLRSAHFTSPCMTEFVATRWYRSPEIVFGSKEYGCASDMWSLGCLIYELYTRQTLLPGLDSIDQICKLLQFKGLPNSAEQQSLRAPDLSRILQCFKVSQQPRGTYYHLIKDNSVIEMLDKLLEYNPNKRWTADDLLASPYLEEFCSFQVESTRKLLLLPLNDNKLSSVSKYKQTIYKFFASNHANSASQAVAINGHSNKQLGRLMRLALRRDRSEKVVEGKSLRKYLSNHKDSSSQTIAIRSPYQDRRGVSMHKVKITCKPSKHSLRVSPNLTIRPGHLQAAITDRAIFTEQPKGAAPKRQTTLKCIRMMGQNPSRKNSQAERRKSPEQQQTENKSPKNRQLRKQLGKLLRSNADYIPGVCVRDC